MARRIQVVMGGSQESYEALEKCGKENKTDWWSCLKDTKNGDLLFFYFKDPKRAIVASATASGDAEPGGRKGHNYIVWFKNVNFFEKAITLQSLRKEIPEWGWLKRTRKETHIKESIANKLLKLANLERHTIPELPPKINVSGSGFGTPKQRLVIEQAARKEFKKYFKGKGYTLVSRESEKVGYDFDARRKTQELHVEVKGISGPVTRFIITAKEAECARADGNFRLAAVTEATTKNRKVHVFTGKGFLKKCGLKPISYFAEVKHSLLA